MKFLEGLLLVIRLLAALGNVLTKPVRPGTWKRNLRKKEDRVVIPTKQS